MNSRKQPLESQCRVALGPIWLVALFLLFGEKLPADQQKLFLSPETIRPQFSAPNISTKPQTSGSRRPQPISIGWNAKEGPIGQLRGRHLEPIPNFPNRPADVFIADGNNRVELPNGEELRIDRIEMLYRTGPEVGDISYEVFDGATLGPLFDPGKKPSEEVHETTLKLQFAGPENLQVDDSEIQFANGIPFRQNGNHRGYWETRTRLGFRVPLYSMPVVVSSEFRYGKEKKFSIPLQLDAIYRNEDFEVRVIACSYFPPGAEHGPVAVGPRGKELGIDYLDYQPGEMNDGRTVCCLEFVPIRSLPRGFNRTGGGLTWFHRYGHRLEFLAIEDSEGAPPESQEFAYRDRALAIFQLPGIPGVPKENRNLQNIFDLRVPFVELEDATEHFWFIANQSGLKFRALYERYPYPEVPYPITYSNVTLMEMLEDWRTRYGVHQFILDEENVLVEITDPK